MEIVELRDLTRKQSPVQYRRHYSAQAVVQYAEQEEAASVEFVLEHTAAGEVSVQLQIKDEVNYPLVPVIRSLKKHIQNLDRTGRLP